MIKQEGSSERRCPFYRFCSLVCVVLIWGCGRQHDRFSETSVGVVESDIARHPKTEPHSDAALDLGNVLASSAVTKAITFRNTTLEPQSIIRVVPSCSCIIAKLPRGDILPGADAVIEVTYRAPSMTGHDRKFVDMTLRANSGTTQKRLSMTALVLEPLAILPESIAFGDVIQGGRQSRTLHVANYTGRSISGLSVSGLPVWLKAKVNVCATGAGWGVENAATQFWAIDLTLFPDKIFNHGMQTAFLQLESDGAAIGKPVKVSVRPATKYVVSPASLYLPSLDTNEIQTKPIVVRAVEAVDFDLAASKCSVSETLPGNWSFTWSRQNANLWVLQLAVTAPDNVATHRVDGELLIEFPGDQWEASRIPIHAIFNSTDE